MKRKRHTYSLLLHGFITCLISILHEFNILLNLRTEHCQLNCSREESKQIDPRDKLQLLNKGTFPTYQKVVLPMRILKQQVFNTSRNVQNTSMFYFEPRCVTTISRLSFLPPSPAQPHFLALLNSHKTSLITILIAKLYLWQKNKKICFFSVLLLKISY